jgi:hypothetical protein
VKDWIIGHTRALYWVLVLIFAALFLGLSAADRISLLAALVLYFVCSFGAAVLLNSFAFRELKAAKYLQYVATHGNKLHIRTEAEELLEML